MDRPEKHFLVWIIIMVVGLHLTVDLIIPTAYVLIDKLLTMVFG